MLAFARLCQLPGGFFNRFAAHQGFALRQNVGYQNFMVIADFIMRNGRNNKIDRHNIRPLVNQLEKRMLNIRSRPAEQNRSRRIIDNFAVLVNKFAVALHIQLLQISRQITQILVIWHNRVALESEKVVIPNAQQRQNNRNIMFQIRLGKMAVHGEGAFQHPFKIVHAGHQSD